MKLPEQLVRIGIVTGAILVLAVLTRFVLVPASYFDSALHRSTTEAREVEKPMHFAGQSACVECHEEVGELKATGYHKSLSCEVCHGPSIEHTENPTEVSPPAPRDRKFCPVCHAYDAARPTGFPQINPSLHNPLKACFTCHDPHDPTPPEVPRECSACHAEIARTKALSSHALLECTTCHEAPAQHKTAPRSALPSKPQDRAFCGQCHGLDSSNPDPPKIDLAEHGGRYLCWECHYPHLPEGS